MLLSDHFMDVQSMPYVLWLGIAHRAFSQSFAITFFNAVKNILIHAPFCTYVNIYVGDKHLK